MKIRRVEDELFHADRRTDMKNLIVAFRNFANALKTNNVLTAYTYIRESQICKYFLHLFSPTSKRANTGFTLDTSDAWESDLLEEGRIT